MAKIIVSLLLILGFSISVISISATEFYIQGQVVDSSHKAISGAELVAYKIDGEGFHTFSAISNGDGSFKIAAIDTGFYQLLCLPSSMSRSVPTWYYRQSDKNFAQLIHLRGSIDSILVECLPQKSKSNGTFSIYGKIALEQSTKDGKCTTCCQQSQSLSASCRVLVALLNNQNECITWQIVDSLGRFEFPSLKAGYYYIRVSEPNYETKTQGIPLVSNQAVYLLLSKSNERVTLADNKDQNPELYCFGSQLACNIAVKSVTLYTMLGSSLVSSNSLPVSIANISSGTYIVKIESLTDTIYFKKISFVK